MAPLIRRESENSEVHPFSLWVGNVGNSVTESDLLAVFSRFGALDCFISYSSRSFAFVYFRRGEDARAAREALQGMVVLGTPMKIEFARPAKPCKSLWVGGFSPSTTKGELENEFLKFGKIEDFKFFWDRNSALVEYVKLEDASQALKGLNGKQIGGAMIRVDFLRLQTSRREQGPEFHDSRDGQFSSRTTGHLNSAWMPQDSIINYSEPYSGSKRQHSSQSSVIRKGEGQPSNVLWVGYPPSIQLEEQMLYNAMILFGEIERIKSFPSRHYSFVEFRSVDEARRAKEGLQGRLFNDPRISIMYSSSGVVPGKEYNPGIPESRPDAFVNELPFRHVDVFSPNGPMVSNNFPGPSPPSGILASNVMRTVGSHEPPRSGPGLNELAALRNFQDASPNNLMGPNWRRPSPSTLGMLPSPVPSIRPSVRPVSGAWDVSDANQFQRDSKRSRVDGAVSISNPSFPLRKSDDLGLGLDDLYGQHDGSASSSFSNIQGKNRSGLVDPRLTNAVAAQSHSGTDYIWRGIIAKGGATVCHARCVAIEKGLSSKLPEVVNCSARTGLDLLTKHYAEAVGFEVVFFLPDSEDDFASYTEFLCYLGSKDRAGVAKLDDGTTLFLVPPSDFLSKVLKVSGPERLYGVVLKLAQQVPSGASMQQQSHRPVPSSQYSDRQQIPPHVEYSLIPQKERVLHMDHNSSILHEDSSLSPKLRLPSTSESLATQSISQDRASSNTAVVSQAGLTLTPELIAHLASLLPGGMQSSASVSAPQSLGSSIARPSLPPSVAPDRGTLSQGWNQDHQTPPSQQSGNQFHPQAQPLPQFQNYPTVTQTPGHTALAVPDGQIQDSTFNLPQLGTISSRPLTNLPVPSQSGQFAVSPQVNQQYQLEIHQNSQNAYGMGRAEGPTTFSSQVDGASNRVNPALPNQVQQLQSMINGAGQWLSDDDADKSQRYQSTIQFAADLLEQIRKQQQQTNQAEQWPGKQQ